MTPRVQGRRGRTKRAKPRQPELPLARANDASPRAGARRASCCSRSIAPGWANLVRLHHVGPPPLRQGRVARRRGPRSASAPPASSRCGGDSCSPTSPSRRRRSIGDLRDAFGDRLYAILARHRRADDVPREARLRARAAAARIPLVAATEVLYHSRARRPLQDVLTCIRHGVTLATAGRLIRGNDEHDLRAPHAFARALRRRARRRRAHARDRRALHASRSASCAIAIRPSACPTAARRRSTCATLDLRRRARGATATTSRRTCARSSTPSSRVIEELDYPGYFLTMHEIVVVLPPARHPVPGPRLRRQLGGLLLPRHHRGRSGPHGPAVRALPLARARRAARHRSRHRARAPRGGHPARLLASTAAITRRWSATSSATARARRCATSARRSASPRPRSIAPPSTSRCTARVERRRARRARPRRRIGAAALDHLARLSDEILEFPRHLSIHPGGFLLGHEPVHDIVPDRERLDARPHRHPVGQGRPRGPRACSRSTCSASARSTSSTSRFDLLRKHRGIDLSMATIPAEDPATYDMICTADTVGTFQIESRAQMSMLPRLRPRTFYDLVVEVSLVRPGPISGGMVHPVPAPPRRPRAGRVSAPVASSPCSRRRSACRCSRSR